MKIKLINVAVMIMFFFSFAGCDNSVVSNQPQTPIATSTSSVITNNQMAEVTDVQNDTDDEASFEENLPANLPETYILKEILDIPEQQAKTAQYVWNDPSFSGEMLFITQQLQAPEVNWDTETEVENVEFGICKATFIQGDWWEEKWEKDAPVFRLQWEIDGVFYMIMHLHNETSSPGYLDKEALIELANQMVICNQ